MMGIELTLLTILFLSVIGGVIVAKMQNRRKKTNLIRERLELAFSQSTVKEPSAVNLRKVKDEHTSIKAFSFLSSIKRSIKLQCEIAGLPDGYEKIKQLAFLLLLTPVILSIAFDIEPLYYGIAAGLLLVSIPFVMLRIKVEKTKQKFKTQLPEAIELIVSVLKTGHSIPRAIQTVSEEIPAPLGTEFREVHQRLNLGQQLSEALNITTTKYDSYELDLIRRAVSIQSEVGGSLAELLDKTNSTLRQRIKLARHVRVLTSQSRLTAIIVGLLPLILATALNYLSPGYLDPLITKETGRLLLIFAVALEIVGIFIMRKMSVIKV